MGIQPYQTYSHLTRLSSLSPRSCIHLGLTISDRRGERKGEREDKGRREECYKRRTATKHRHAGAAVRRTWGIAHCWATWLRDPTSIRSAMTHTTYPSSCPRIIDMQAWHSLDPRPRPQSQSQCQSSSSVEPDTPHRRIETDVMLLSQIHPWARRISVAPVLNVLIPQPDSTDEELPEPAPDLCSPFALSGLLTLCPGPGVPDAIDCLTD